MESLFPKYEFPIEGIASTGKPGESAGIYLLDGRWHLASFQSADAILLQAAGALHIATLSFPLTASNPFLN